MRPPAMELRVPHSDGWTVGADVGGTKVIAGLVDPEGRVVRRQRRDVPAREGAEAVTACVAECITACAQDGDAAPTAVGIGVAGQVDATTGLVRYAPNLRWRDFPFGPRLAEALGLPVTVSNDVRTITLGEWKFGAGKGARDLLCIFIGTGVGGGVVVDGSLLEGAQHATGEIGHATLVANGRPCHCPHRGCLEAYVSGWAIEERAREEARARPEAAAQLLSVAGSLEAISPRAVELAMLAGDAFSESLMERISGEFASGVVGLVNAFNPECVIVGGKIAECFPSLVTAAQAAVRAECQPPAAVARVVAGALGPDAGILGAAHLARTSAHVELVR